MPDQQLIMFSDVINGIGRPFITSPCVGISRTLLYMSRTPKPQSLQICIWVKSDQGSPFRGIVLPTQEWSTWKASNNLDIWKRFEWSVVLNWGVLLMTAVDNTEAVECTLRGTDEIFSEMWISTFTKASSDFRHILSSCCIKLRLFCWDFSVSWRLLLFCTLHF